MLDFIKSKDGITDNFSSCNKRWQIFVNMLKSMNTAFQKWILNKERLRFLINTLKRFSYHIISNFVLFYFLHSYFLFNRTVILTPSRLNIYWWSCSINFLNRESWNICIANLPKNLRYSILTFSRVTEYLY